MILHFYRVFGTYSGSLHPNLVTFGQLEKKMKIIYNFQIFNNILLRLFSTERFSNSLKFEYYFSKYFMKYY